MAPTPLLELYATSVVGSVVLCRSLEQLYFMPYVWTSLGLFALQGAVWKSWDAGWSQQLQQQCQRQLHAGGPPPVSKSSSTSVTAASTASISPMHRTMASLSSRFDRMVERSESLGSHGIILS
ncbi:MAG: hypothetical protein M4579_002999 [Chaenotheca gracillima]|nr:MAG: hypothetical protein M4579_002999 [Chaenotheca gracillima]